MTNQEKAEKDLLRKSFLSLYYEISAEVESFTPYSYEVQLSDVFKYLYPDRRLKTILSYCEANNIDLGNYKYDIKFLISEIKCKYKIFQKYYLLKVQSLEDPGSFINKIEGDISRSGFDKRKISFLKIL